MMIPPVAWSVQAQGRARRKLLLRPRSGLGEDVIPSEVGAEVEPSGRARRRPSSEIEAEPWGRARRSPSSEAEARAEPWGRARRSPSPEAEAQGRARRSFLWRLRLDSAVVSLTLVGDSSRSGAGGVVFLSGQSVGGRSDCGHFDLAD
jgi:hypothetical protein